MAKLRMVRWLKNARNDIQNKGSGGDSSNNEQSPIREQELGNFHEYLNTQRSRALGHQETDRHKPVNQNACIQNASQCPY